MKRMIAATLGLGLLGAASVMWALAPTSSAPTSNAPTTTAPQEAVTTAPRLAQRTGDAVSEIRDEPDVAARRARELADPALDYSTRRRAADHLAHAQTPAAQAALRSGISAALEDPNLPVAGKALLAQRLGFVREPDQATLDLALQIARAEAPGLRRAGLMTLGAVAKHSGATEVAQGPIREATESADPAERAVGYRAFGNLGSPEALSALRAAAGGETDGVVLAGVAQGLGADPSAAGTLALARLASTSHAPTQLRALTGLIGRSLSAEAAGHLAAAGAPEALFAENASAWTSAAAGALTERSVRRAAEAMLMRGDVGPQVRARLRQALNL